MPLNHYDHGERPVRVLLLDVMDTIVHDPFFDEVLAFFGLTLDQFLAVKNRDAWIQFEYGQIDDIEYLKDFFKDGRNFDTAGLKACLRDSYRWLEGMEELLAELHRRGVPMHALSNYPVWWEIIDQKLTLSRYLDWSFVSCLTGIRKPAVDAYRHAARVLGVAAGDCLFVDDREHNCAAARGVGMNATRFVDAVRLRSDLENAGLL